MRSRWGIGIIATFVCACSHATPPVAPTAPEGSQASASSSAPSTSLDEFVGSWLSDPDSQFGPNRIQIDAGGYFDVIVTRPGRVCGRYGTVQLTDSDGPAFSW